MPYITVKVSGTKSQEKAEQIGELVTRHTAEILFKKKELTSVSVEFIDAAQWFIGGMRCDAQPTFYLEIKITEGTNTKDQKAKYVGEVFRSMETVLGKLNPASYVVIHDVRGDSWGYEGLTQEYRYIKGKSL
jgi:4-oxalocrotonate tautomerase